MCFVRRVLNHDVMMGGTEESIQRWKMDLLRDRAKRMSPTITLMDLPPHWSAGRACSLYLLGGDSSCSWVLVQCTGPNTRKELLTVLLGEGGEMCGEPTSSSTFAVDVKQCPM